MSDTNRVGLRGVKETTFGTTPSNPKFFEIPTSAQPNLGFSPATVVSNLLRDDRQVSDLILVGGEAGGEANSEFAFGIHDALIEAAFYSTWQERYVKENGKGSTEITAVVASTDDYDVTIGATTGSITVDFALGTPGTITRASGSFITDGFEVGDYVIISGAVDGGNNAVLGPITVLTALVMTLADVPASETADAGVTISAVLPSTPIALVKAEGFTQADNNLTFKVQAGTTELLIVSPAGRADETPPYTARLKHVGFECAAADVVATAGGLTTTAFNLLSLKLAAGDWVYITGTGGTWPATNIGWGRVASVAAGVLTWETAPTGWTTDAGTGATIQFFVGDSLINGTTRQGFTLERTFNDHSPVSYQYLTGFLVDQCVLTGQSQSILEANFTFVGMGSDFTTTRVSGATSLGSPTVDVMNTSSNVAQIRRGGTSLLDAGVLNLVTEISFTINNNGRRKNAIGFLGAGEFNVSGTLNAYFDDTAIADDVVNNTETSVDVRFEDDGGHVFLLDAPRIKYSEGAPEVAGKNQDVTISPAFQAIKDETFGYTLKAQRFYSYAVSV